MKKFQQIICILQSLIIITVSVWIIVTSIETKKKVEKRKANMIHFIDSLEKHEKQYIDSINLKL